jgi:hypothetical protein
MQRNDQLTPPVQYSPIWLIIGIVLVLAVIAVNVFIFWSTRKKKIKTIESLPMLPKTHISIEALRNKYLQMITTFEFKYHNHEIDLRQLHLLLSTTIRLFVFEAKGVAVHKFTLTEIQHTEFKALYDVILQYYPNEFDALLKGDANSAIELARRMVLQWS